MTALDLLDMLGGDWTEHAACLGEPTELFFPEIPGQRTDYSAALAICGECPVRSECLAYAVNHDVQGMWGGRTTEQRHEIKRRERRTA